jgi:hypothetical protein
MAKRQKHVTKQGTAYIPPKKRKRSIAVLLRPWVGGGIAVGAALVVAAQIYPDLLGGYFYIDPKKAGHQIKQTVDNTIADIKGEKRPAPQKYVDASTTSSLGNYAIGIGMLVVVGILSIFKINKMMQRRTRDTEISRVFGLESHYGTPALPLGQLFDELHELSLPQMFNTETKNISLTSKTNMMQQYEFAPASEWGSGDRAIAAAHDHPGGIPLLHRTMRFILQNMKEDGVKFTEDDIKIMNGELGALSKGVAENLKKYIKRIEANRKIY